MNLRYKSDCSGIEAASVAWGPLGWEAVAFSEIDKFPAALLAYHYPEVPNVGDFTKDDWSKYKGLDVIIAGTPCQDYSIAGKRAGAEGERGNLTIKYAEMLNESQIEFKVFLWENVPGVLSDRGNAFGRFLGLLAGEDAPLVSPGGRWTDAGYVLGPLRSIAWRCLDAQYFGLAQRRKRVFLVACPVDGLDPREILFEFDGLRRDTPPGRSQEEDVAGTLESSPGRSIGAGTPAGAITQALTGSLGNGGPDDNRAQGGFYVACGGHHFDELVDVAATIKTNTGSCQDYESETFIVANTLRGEGFDASEDGTGRANLIVSPPLTHKPHADNISQEDALIISFHGAQDPDVSGDITHSLGRNHGLEACVASVAFSQNQLGEIRSGDITGTLNRNSNASGRNTAMALTRSGVRRLLPVECERLQGFEDDYTLIPRTKHLTALPMCYLRKCYRKYVARTGSAMSFEDVMKLAADGPRYKALGNSMAVPVIRWLGERIGRAILLAEGTK